MHTKQERYTYHLTTNKVVNENIVTPQTGRRLQNYCSTLKKLFSMKFILYFIQIINFTPRTQWLCWTDTDNTHLVTRSF